jgi:hypothetical protein
MFLPSATNLIFIGFSYCFFGLAARGVRIIKRQPFEIPTAHG